MIDLLDRVHTIEILWNWTYKCMYTLLSYIPLDPFTETSSNFFVAPVAPDAMKMAWVGVSKVLQKNHPQDWYSKFSSDSKTKNHRESRPWLSSTRNVLPKKVLE